MDFTQTNPFEIKENQTLFTDVNTQARSFLRHIKQTSELSPIMVGDNLETKLVWHHEESMYDIDRIGYSFAIKQQEGEDGHTGWKLILKFFYSEKPKGGGFGCLEAGSYAILERVPMPAGMRYENPDIEDLNSIMQKRYYEKPSTQSTRNTVQTRYQSVVR